MIIGFTGKMGVGKSTAIEVLRSLSPGTRLCKFAQPLYDMQELIYNRISSVHTRPSTFVKDRKLLQWLGTEWGRGTISESIWIDLWTDTALKAGALRADKLVVCDDVRFNNEAEALKALGGTVVQLLGPSRDVDAGIAGHASESGILPTLVTHQVHNDGTQAEFQEKIRTLFEKIRA